MKSPHGRKVESRMRERELNSGQQYKHWNNILQGIKFPLTGRKKKRKSLRV
jgi:hypothetical protein